MAGKGTPAMGKKDGHTHIACRRCGNKSFHTAHKICASCGFGRTATIRKYTWMTDRAGKRAK